MHRVLVVANRTLGGEALLEEVRQRVAGGGSEFYVVVPARPDQPAAEARLGEALERFRGLGAVADGEVGDPHPVAAVHDALEGHPADEIIVSTLPAGISRWIENDTPSKIGRVFNLPVVHVISTEP